MANETINPGQWQPNKPLGTGEGESPMMNSAQGPRIEARTMGSDVSSIQTGDAAPKAYTPQPSTPAPAGSGPSAAPLNPQSFELPQIDLGSQSQVPQEPVKKKKGIFVVLVTFIIIVGLAALGYFVVYPLFFESQPAPVTTPETQTPPPETPPAEQPSVPPVSETPATTTPETTQPEKPIHVSVFKTPADNSMESASVITGASLGSVTLPNTQSPSITEVIQKDTLGNLGSFGTIMQSIFGGDFSSLQGMFPGTNVSEFIYIGQNGNRSLGVIAEINSSTPLAATKSAFAQIFEASQGLSGIFANDPGTKGSWKDGQTSGVSNRYLAFSNPGFSINYGWSGTKLVISGSYDGFKAALQRVQ